MQYVEFNISCQLTFPSATQKPSPKSSKKDGAHLRDPSSGTLKPKPHPKQIVSSASVSADVFASADDVSAAGNSTAVVAAVDAVVVVSIVSGVALARSLATSAARGS